MHLIYVITSHHFDIEELAIHSDAILHSINIDTKPLVATKVAKGWCRQTLNLLGALDAAKESLDPETNAMLVESSHMYILSKFSSSEDVTKLQTTFASAEKLSCKAIRFENIGSHKRGWLFCFNDKQTQRED